MHSLERLGQILRDNPDTGTGVQIRALLWSLLNQHHVINLWTLCGRLNDEPARLAAEVLTAALLGRLTDSQVKQTLVACGEMDRWDRQQTDESLAEARQALTGNLRRTPPGEGHCRLAAALRVLERG